MTTIEQNRSLARRMSSIITGCVSLELACCLKIYFRLDHIFGVANLLFNSSLLAPDRMPVGKYTNQLTGSLRRKHCSTFIPTKKSVFRIRLPQITGMG